MVEKEESDGWLRLRTITGAEDYTPEENTRHKLPVILSTYYIYSISCLFYRWSIKTLKTGTLVTESHTQYTFSTISDNEAHKKMSHDTPEEWIDPWSRGKRKHVEIDDETDEEVQKEKRKGKHKDKKKKSTIILFLRCV